MRKKGKKEDKSFEFRLFKKLQKFLKKESKKASKRNKAVKFKSRRDAWKSKFTIKTDSELIKLKLYSINLNYKKCPECGRDMELRESIAGNPIYWCRNSKCGNVISLSESNIEPIILN